MGGEEEGKQGQKAGHSTREEKRNKVDLNFIHMEFLQECIFYSLYNLKSALVNVTMKNITLAPLVDYLQQLFHPSSECT